MCRDSRKGEPRFEELQDDKKEKQKEEKEGSGPNEKVREGVNMIDEFRQQRLQNIMFVDVQKVESRLRRAIKDGAMPQRNREEKNKDNYRNQKRKWNFKWTFQYVIEQKNRTQDSNNALWKQWD